MTTRQPYLILGDIHHSACRGTRRKRIRGHPHHSVCRRLILTRMAPATLFHDIVRKLPNPLHSILDSWAPNDCTIQTHTILKLPVKRKYWPGADAYSLLDGGVTQIHAGTLSLA